MAKRAARQDSLGQQVKTELLDGQDVGQTAPEPAPEPAPDSAPPVETPTEPESPDFVPGAPEQPAEPQEPQEPQEPTFLDRLGQLGFEGVESEEDARNRLLEAYQQQQEQIQAAQQERERLEQLARYGNQYLQTLREQEASRTQGQAPSGQLPASAQAASPWWSPPEYDSRWVEKWRELDPQTGQPRWKTDTPPEIITKTQAYAEYVDEWQHRLVTDPRAALRPAILGVLQEDPEQTRKILEPLLDQYYQSRRQQEEQQDFWGRIRAENADWIFVRDPRTNQPTNQLTREAREIIALGDRLMEGGLSDPALAWDAARAMYASQLSAQAQPAQPAAPQPTAQERHASNKRDFARAHAGSVSSRGGSVRRETQEPAVQNANLSYGRQLVQMMEDNGDL